MGLFDKFIQKKENDEFIHLDKKQMQIFEEFTKKIFGSDYMIMHELALSDIHLDVLVFSPTKENNYYTLVTMGMCGYKMNIPKGSEDKSLERAELIMHLPNNWNIKSFKEEDYWPIEQLKNIARMPIYNKTYLAGWHTINNGSAVSTNTELSAFILLPILNDRLNIKELGNINFYTLMPLYKEELEYLYENGTNKLMDLCERNNIQYPPVLDINRKNLCKISNL